MEVKKATIKAFDSGTYKATVQIAGSLATWLKDVPVARNIAANEMVVGRSCAVLLFDAPTPSDAVVVAVYT
ncbi:MAG: hypothetical protein HYY31_01430 [Chloroflexi bacterium]|nr:hypothetical protein [Chloroflexota bacterium]